MLLGLVVTGCLAERHLVVETTPTGALVELDWKPIGTTPLDIVIDHSGRLRLLVSLDGYEPVLREVDFPSTWRNTFPIDIFTELLNPLPKDEVQIVRLTLSPRTDAEPIDLAPILERAELLRRAGPSGPRELREQRP